MLESAAMRPKVVPAKPSVVRDTVMISHANPEDNEFALWLALQLTKDGYKVWSDVTNLIGGEAFWTDIEYAIRNHAIKFIYVLSRVSNESSSRGFRKELDVADVEARRIVAQYPRFILPMAIDTLPSSDYNIYLHHLNCIQSREWSQGLRNLLKRLRTDKVPRFENQFNPSVISDWWRRYRSARAGVTRKPDKYLSNWFPITAIPQTVFWHRLETTDGTAPILDFEMPFKFIQKGDRVFTFATESEISAKIGSNLRIASSESHNVQSAINTLPADQSDPNFKHLLIELLRTAWDSWIDTRVCLGIYSMANGRRCTFFKPEKEREPLRANFIGVDGKPAYRNLTGTFSRRTTKVPELRTQHCWHYGISAKVFLWPQLMFHISAHVLFSDDGQHIWESKPRLHSARRSNCKSWYNDEWRDRLVGAMTYLANGTAQIDIPLSESTCIAVSTSPIEFESKITCTPTEQVYRPTEDADDDDEDDSNNATGETF
jgi:hypothetical protein